MRWLWLAGLAAACAAASPQARAPRAAKAPVTSNVLFSDYAGSQACAECHRDIAERFSRSPMHKMTRDAATAEIRAPFTGDVFEFRGDSARMETVGDRRYVRLSTRKHGEQIFRISEVIGGRYREDFAAVEVRGTEAGARTVYRNPKREILPVSWVFGTNEWRYKGYSVQIPERRGMVAGPTWKRTCIFCHNTAPGIALLYDDLSGIERPPYQGSAPSNLLGKRKLAFSVTDPDGLATALGTELERIGAPAADTTLGAAMHGTWKHFDREHLVELGIGCETCHGGSREHARDPSRLPSFAPESPLFSVSPKPGQNHACARCHSVLFSGYAHTWEGGHRRRNPGGSSINSGEARDFLLGACAGEMTCTTCHDPHAEDDRAALEKLATPAGNRVCTPCHSELASDSALRAHAHHDPKREGGACIACHMPKKNIGLGYDLTRYHRIGSPTDRVRAEQDRPLECALCHRDASVQKLAQSMQTWWKKQYDPGALRRLYGDDLEVNVLVATLERGYPHEQTVALVELSRTGDRAHAPRIAAALENELPLTRYFAREALSRLTGKRPALDMSLPGAELRAAGEAWLAAQGTSMRSTDAVSWSTK